ncbi:uncharacterized protein Z520_09342 [Fonsecaea multimorphosa CBS 102226]|uniref:RING-type E3 ubiquitin transferase n=1 Tax=Fonsecaea multimorphosa CBS 102226 TaxID=1442371 RepID=A0A0D2JNY1_9EURO|nr:uncharacterized protein Z520_09342 [Fonsecaea multimorphosa CBS 102226]KIX95032.1 hypothetical protein Z520_09342 [Fonsecaea multimorphosa CBS 102226]OAL20677.1 hypothetical protein AYO22_08686 [Fonsecaea multimorphosa]
MANQAPSSSSPPPPVSAPAPTSANMEYPFATSPDILRTHQKDAYFSGSISSQASTILRALLGARFAHKYSEATNHLSELLYLCITTLLGNRTLGEEYCDVIQVEDDTLRLAGLGRRVGYIASVVFAPWILGKSLPALRRRLRSKLEWNIEHAKQKQQQHHGSRHPPSPRSLKLQEYILKHLDTLTSPQPIYAVSLAIFYFTGAYYHIAKRLFGLRYVFTKQIKPNEERVGYEVLGVLLVLQMAVQSALHIRDTYMDATTSTTTGAEAKGASTAAMLANGVEIPISSSLETSSAGQLLSAVPVQSYLPPGLGANTATPVLDTPRYALEGHDEIMAWIPAGHQRKCTLCLEPFRDPSVTTCGHVFCWTCVQDWVKEKAECPLCRQSVLSQKILPLRG